MYTFISVFLLLLPPPHRGNAFERYEYHRGTVNPMGSPSETEWNSRARFVAVYGNTLCSPRVKNNIIIIKQILSLGQLVVVSPPTYGRMTFFPCSKVTSHPRGRRRQNGFRMRFGRGGRHWSTDNRGVLKNSLQHSFEKFVSDLTCKT